MARRKRPTEDPLKALGELANFLDQPTFLNDTTVNQRKAMREAADVVRDAIETFGQELDPRILMAFWTGAAAQAHVAAESNPLTAMLGSVLGGQQKASKTPHITLTVSVAYLARDLLTGERVE